MTHTQLSKAVRRWVPYWRDRLGLRDWHIDVKYWTPEEDRLAAITPDFADRTAALGIMGARSPRERDIWKANGNDPELIIVHELLHIHFLSLGVKGGEYSRTRMSKVVMAEQVINALAQCLVDRRRGRL